MCVMCFVFNCFLVLVVDPVLVHVGKMLYH